MIWACHTHSPGERTVRIRKVVGSIPIGSTKMEIAAVFTAAISRLTTEIPQTGFSFDHWKGTPFSEGVPFICFITPQDLSFLQISLYDIERSN